MNGISMITMHYKYCNIACVTRRAAYSGRHANLSSYTHTHSQQHAVQHGGSVLTKQRTQWYNIFIVLLSYWYNYCSYGHCLKKNRLRFVIFLGSIQIFPSSPLNPFLISSFSSYRSLQLCLACFCSCGVFKKIAI